MEKFFELLKISEKAEIKFHRSIKLIELKELKLTQDVSFFPELMLERIIHLDNEFRVLPKYSNPESENLLSPVISNPLMWGEEVLEAAQYEINPMDIFVFLFSHCDLHLRQVLAAQICKLQFAHPLIAVGAISSNESTSMLYSNTYENIIKTYYLPIGNTRSFRVYDEKLHIVSFIRIGKCCKSVKSQLMNLILGFSHDCFVHRQSRDYRKTRLLYDGTVEMNWYLPQSNKNHENYFHEEPLTFLNLRGNACMYVSELDFIMNISALVYVMITLNDIDDNELTMFKKYLKEFKHKICLVFTDWRESARERKKEFQDFPGRANITIILHQSNLNETAFLVKQSINMLIKQYSSNKYALQDCEKFIKGKIQINPMDKVYCSLVGEQIELQNKIFYHMIKNTLKTYFLPLQSLGWKDYAKAKRSQSQIISRDGILDYFLGHTEKFFKVSHARRKNRTVLFDTHPLLKYGDLLVKSSDIQYCTSQWSMLKMALERFNLHISNLSEVQSKSLETYGVQHFTREFGQIYETCLASLYEQRNKFKLGDVNPIEFPKIFAKLILAGHPFEILDGDVQHVPLVWVRKVLEEVSDSVGHEKKIFILGVLGIQSSGKSTLLNSMFGLQFPTSVGRCTRGVSMQLVQINYELSINLGYDFMLILDSEGLKGTDPGKQESVNFDNELATFIVGISDLTIVNMKGESHKDWEDIFQVIIMALVRIGNRKEKPKCLFVHQNVDPTGKMAIRDGYTAFVSKLDEVTNSISQQEVQACSITKFTDIIDFEFDTCVHLFPSLYTTYPPMSIISNEYCYSSQKLKTDIVEYSGSLERFHTIFSWSSKMSNVWKSLLRENFVFSYKNMKEKTCKNEIEDKLLDWAQSYWRELEKLELELKNMINISNCDQIESTYDKCLSNLKEKCSEIHKESEKKIIKDYFSMHQDAKIFKNWETRCEEYFKITREQSQEKVKRQLEIFYQLSLKTKPIVERFLKSRDIILKRAKESLIRWRMKPGDIDPDTSIEQLFENEWPNWVLDLNLEENLTIQNTFISSIKKVLNNLQSSYTISQEDEKKIEKLLTNWRDVYYMKSQFALGSRHYTIYDLKKKCQLSLNLDNECWIDYIFSIRNNELLTKSINKVLNICHSDMRHLINEINVLYKIYFSSVQLTKIVPIHDFEFIDIADIILRKIETFKEKQTENVNLQINLEDLFIYEIVIYYCLKIMLELENANTIYNQMTLHRQELYFLKLKLKNIFRDLCKNNPFTLSVVGANGLAEILYVKMCNKISEQIQFQILESYSKSENSINSKRDLQMQSLNELAECVVDDAVDADNIVFSSIIIYASSTNETLRQDYISSIRKHYNDLKESTTFQNIILKEFNDLANTYSKLLHKSLKPECEVLVSLEDKSKGASVAAMKSKYTINIRWKEAYHILVSTHTRNFALSDLDELIIEFSDIQDADEFVHNFSQAFELCYDGINIKKWIEENVQIDTVINLNANVMFACKEKCPFCNEPCASTLTSMDHVHYSGSFHRPLGVNGWYHKNSNQFVAYSCNRLKLENVGTRIGNLYFDYEEALNEVKKWEIRKEDAVVEPAFWQWVLSKFSKQFCHFYDYRPNEEAIKIWSQMTREQVMSSLQLQFEDFNNSNGLRRFKKIIGTFFQKDLF